MRVLVTGAYGFIGAQIAAALVRAGHDVVCAVRRPDRHARFAHLPVVTCDFARDTLPAVWLPRLRDVDAVVNCAGILRETGVQTFDAVHRATPGALFAACREAGVRRVIQVSALGDPADSEFVRSKHAGDAHLATLDLEWTILRPSVVYCTEGSYGGTSLLRALAALPGVLLLPGDGGQRFQPIAGADLARAVVRLVETGGGARAVLYAVGPTVVTLAQYLRAFRHWLGSAEPKLVLRGPRPLVQAGAWLGEIFGRGPLGRTMLRMLERGNVAPPGAAEAFTAAVGFQPRSLSQVLADAPSHVQDRWHARLYALRPMLRVSLALLWLGSGLAGLLYPLADSVVLLAAAGVPAVLAPALVYGASVVDIVVGAALLLRIGVRWCGIVMLCSLLAYTLFLGIAVPQLWLAPFGPLLKNLPLVPAVLALLVLEGGR